MFQTVGDLDLSDASQKIYDAIENGNEIEHLLKKNVNIEKKQSWDHPSIRIYKPDKSKIERTLSRTNTQY